MRAVCGSGLAEGRRGECLDGAGNDLHIAGVRVVAVQTQRPGASFLKTIATHRGKDFQSRLRAAADVELCKTNQINPSFDGGMNVIIVH